ncbi:glutamine--fructose-6-phosphate transaminase (isomerizing) [bacterium]|nr:glutamine--fructose-6-phosphate transaminase (isomerizing) [bacterium]MCB2179089.1 glutamine--fructose-6-phosphate transaminase (isomerizing) [bacterium]
MCGIFGIIAREERTLGPTLIEAGRMLSYRGYDSVGCATISQAGEIDLRKDVGKVDAVAEKYDFAEMTGKRGILQLRWATFGPPSQANAQPHLDSDGDMVGAHNGNVVNNVELREQFIAEGMTVRSTNDGESCVHAVERYVDQGYNMVDAIRKAYEVLEGDYAFVIGKVDEDVLYAIKKGSGLVAGLAEDAAVLSSDLPSLLPLTRNIMRIEDGEIVILTPDKIELRSVTDGSVIEREIEEVKETMEAAQKGNYPHFMLKEIHEQPQVAKELLHLLDNLPDVDLMVEMMQKADHIYLVGCGTSYHACVLGSVYFSRLAGKATIPVLAPQFIAQYGPALGPNDVGIFVSQSGETKDVLNAIELAEDKGMGVLGLVNVIGSTLMRVSAHHAPLACGYEISVPATKTFTNQVVAFLYLAMRMGGHDTAELASLPDLMQETIEVSAPQVEALMSKLHDVDDLYCLGYGLTFPIALEGALKLKEITYLHCEGMLSTEFKHGPLSAVDEGFPVLFVAGQEDVDLIVSGINETTTRGGMALVFGADDPRLKANGDELVTIPRVDANIEALLSVIPLQLLSYHMSLDLGYDPDFPRNLSKTLTVD